MISLGVLAYIHVSWLHQKIFGQVKSWASLIDIHKFINISVNNLFCKYLKNQGCLQDEVLMEKLAKIVASSQPPTAYQASYYWRIKYRTIMAWTSQAKMVFVTPSL